MSRHSKNEQNDILANRRYEREIEREIAERKRRRDNFLRRRDEEYARAFPQNLKHGHYTRRDI